MVKPTTRSDAISEAEGSVEDLLESKISQKLDALESRFAQFETFLKDDLYKKLKSEVMSELKNEIKEEIKSEVKEDSVKAMDEQNERIRNLETTVEVLQSQVSFLKEKVETNQAERDDLEQYGRRLCLRFGGIEKLDDSNSNCLEIVKNLWEEAGVNVPDPCIDRAHWIGKSYIDNKTGKTYMI